MKHVFLALLCVVGAWWGGMLIGCQPNGAPSNLPAEGNAMYYWRTSLRFDSTERAFMRQQNIRRLYVKFFDVAVESRQGAIPVATLKFNDPVPEGVEVVPTVFIVENCLRDTIGHLAERIVTRVLKMCATNDIGAVRELQVDCDWTLRSREKYFALLSNMRRLLKEHGMNLSATIRLHQLSQPAPPVDYGALMVYNTADPRRLTDHNPILDIRDVEPYMKHLKGYKLPLATAYPLFSWQLLFNGTTFNRFLYGERPVLKLTTDTIVSWHSEVEQILRAKSVVEKRRADASHLIILYHLDKQFISNYTNEDYEKIFSR
ncbi:MAG: hypothetical protein IKH86_12280 [Prevotella sp.]|nr:hypothetical protein [Prevotella sp.]